MLQRSCDAYRDHVITCDGVTVVTALLHDLVLISAINDSGGLMFFLCGIVFGMFLSIECMSYEERH